MDNNKDKDFGLPKTKFEPVNVNSNSSINGRKGGSARVLVFLGFLSLIIICIVGGIFLLKNRDEDDEEEVENKDSSSIFEDTEETKKYNKEKQKVETPKSTTEGEAVSNGNELDEPIADDNNTKKSDENKIDTTTTEEEKQNVTTVDEVPEGEKVSADKSIEKQDSKIIENVDIRKNNIEKVYKPQNKYYVICGAFLDEKNAYKKANEIKQRLQVKIIYPYGKSIKHRVSIAESNNLEEANKIKNRLKKDYPGIWTFKY